MDFDPRDYDSRDDERHSQTSSRGGRTGSSDRDRDDEGEAANCYAEPCTPGIARRFCRRQCRRLGHVIDERHHIPDVPLTLLRILLETMP